MIPKKNRLSACEVNAVFRRGSFFSYGVVSLRIARAESEKKLRFAFAVPKKQFPKATNRNRIKRLLRAACADLLKTGIFGYDIVVLYRGSKNDTPVQDITNDLKMSLKRAHLLQ